MKSLVKCKFENHWVFFIVFNFFLFFFSTKNLLQNPPVRDIFESKSFCISKQNLCDVSYFLPFFSCIRIRNLLQNNTFQYNLFLLWLWFVSFFCCSHMYAGGVMLKFYSLFFFFFFFKPTYEIITPLIVKFYVIFFSTT